MNTVNFDFAKIRNFSRDLDLGFFQFQYKPKKQRFCILFFQFSLEKEAKK